MKKSFPDVKFRRRVVGTDARTRMQAVHRCGCGAGEGSGSEATAGASSWPYYAQQYAARSVVIDWPIVQCLVEVSVNHCNRSWIND